MAEYFRGSGVRVALGEQQLLLLRLGEAQHGLLWWWTILHFRVKIFNVNLLSDKLLFGGVTGLAALLRDLLVFGELEKA